MHTPTGALVAASLLFVATAAAPASTTIAAKLDERSDGKTGEAASISLLEARVSPSRALRWITDQLVEQGLPRVQRPVGVWLGRAKRVKPVRATEANFEALLGVLEQRLPVDQQRSSRSAPYVGSFRHFDPTSGTDALTRADSDYSVARWNKWKYDHTTHPELSSGDVQQDHLTLRSLILAAEAAKFRLNALQHVKESAAAVAQLRGKRAARQRKMRDKKRAKQRTSAQADVEKLGLVAAWEEATERLTSARLAEAGFKRGKSKEALDADARVLQAKQTTEQAEAEYHELTMSLRMDTPGLTLERVEKARKSAMDRMRKMQGREVSLRKLKLEYAHFCLLRESLRQTRLS